MPVTTAPMLLTNLTWDMGDTFSSRRGKVSKNDTSKPTTEKMTVQVECLVVAFIMIEKVRS